MYRRQHRLPRCDEIVQLYFTDKLASMIRPVKEMVGFRRLTLPAGESRRVIFTFDMSQLAFLDRKMRWIIEPGEIGVMAGASSEDIRLKGSFNITGAVLELKGNRTFYAVST